MLFLEDLNKLKCAVPDCDHESHSGEIFLHPQCHPSDGTWTYFDPEDGTVNVICKTCRSHVASIGVASKE